jgi:hypothetical protein
MATLELHELNQNQRASVDRVLKHAEKAAEYMGVTLVDMCRLLVERDATRRPGGARKNAGRPARVWAKLAGIDLLSLPLRIEVEKALNQTRSDKAMSDLAAFRRILAPGTSAARARELHKEMRRALRKPPNAEVERHRANRERRRHHRQMGENQASISPDFSR